MSYVIGEREFRTKKDALEACRRVLYRYSEDAVVDDVEDAQFLTDLLAHHPSVGIKMGCGIDHFQVRRNPQGTVGFWLVRIDGSETDWSIYECLRPSTHEEKVRSAMRTTVVDQVLDFKNSQFASQPVRTCPVSGELVTAQNCHIDHAPPTFLELAAMFARRESGYESIRIVGSTDGLLGDRFVDPAQEARWRQFHANHARLRAVSRRANLSLLRRSPGTKRTC